MAGWCQNLVVPLSPYTPPRWLLHRLALHCIRPSGCRMRAQNLVVRSSFTSSSFMQAADMVMHPSPGHYSGTLVNALLHHCQLPAMQLRSDSAAPLSLEGAAAAAAAGRAGGSVSGSSSDDGSSEAQLKERSASPQAAGSAPPGAQHPAAAGDAEASQLSSTDVDDGEEDEEGGGFMLIPSASGLKNGDATIRPGIVHRLDKGTTGLLVVAKTDAAHLSLAQQASAAYLV